MKNAETQVMRVALFGAVSSFGSALMAELLRRQHEVIAVLDDLNALAPRPGLRAKQGDLFSQERICESIAASSVVICLLDAKVMPKGADLTAAPQDLVLGRVAAGIADEPRLNLHVRQYVNFVV